MRQARHAVHVQRAGWLDHRRHAVRRAVHPASSHASPVRVETGDDVKEPDPAGSSAGRAEFLGVLRAARGVFTVDETPGADPLETVLSWFTGTA